MKKATIILLLLLGFISCTEEEPISDVFIPGDQPSLRPPSWIQGNWYDESNSVVIRFRTDNIIIKKDERELNFENDLPYVHEDFNTNELYQLSLVVNGERQQYIFQQYETGTLGYLHKIMGNGTEILLTQR